MDASLSSESLAVHLDQALDMRSPTVLDFQLDESRLLSAAFATTDAGPIPELKLETVVGAGQSTGATASHRTGSSE